MIDAQTMRIVLGGVTLTVLLLFYWGVYRPTRSRFAGLWTLALLFAASARALQMFDTGDLQLFADRLSGMLAAVAVTCVWFATRSLRRKRLPLWLVGVGPVAIVVPTILGNAPEATRSGNSALFIYMATMFVVASIETWLAWRSRRASARADINREPVVALLVIAVAGTALASYYAVRAVRQVLFGRDGEAIGLGAGSGPNSVILLVCLVAVTFSVSAVSWDQQTDELRRRAMQDDLTGLLGRTEFRLRAEQAFARARSDSTGAVLVVADLDHFKQVNDAHGHTAGDRALVAFATILSDAARPGEIVGRLGGEEFGAVFLGVDGEQAVARLRAISDAFVAPSTNFDFAMPTVSYGLAGLDDGETVAEIYECADLALYRAKADGRDRAVKFSPKNSMRARRVSSLRPGPDTSDAVGTAP